MKAIEVAMRMDLRRRRAEMLTAAVLDKLRPYLSDDPEARREASYALHELFTEEGVEVLSDYDRQTFGLPPRGPDGWTHQEIIALEARRLDLMCRPMVPVVFIPETPKSPASPEASWRS